MSLLTALGAVLAHFTGVVPPAASVLVHVASDVWAELKKAAAADASIVGQQVLAIIENVAQESVSSVNPSTHTQVQFAAGDWHDLKTLHAYETSQPPTLPVQSAEPAHAALPPDAVSPETGTVPTPAAVTPPAEPGVVVPVGTLSEPAPAPAAVPATE